MGAEGSGFLSRVSERVVSWIALGLIVAAGVGLWQMGPDARGALFSGIWRSLAWLLIVAVVPWSARLYIRRVLDVGSNWAGAVLIAALTLADLVAGVLLLSAWPAGLWSWLVCIVLLAIAATYNFLVTEYLADQAGG